MYKDKIQELIKHSSLAINTDAINTEIRVTGKLPTIASSEFLTNKEQGDWAEKVVFKAINEFSEDYFAVIYGRSDEIAAGEQGFAEFYTSYQQELNTIGKKPDILIYRTTDFPQKKVNIENDEDIKKAIAAIEVRSSAFLVDKYTAYMEERQRNAINQCKTIREEILASHLGQLLEKKNKTIYTLIAEATDETFQELDFRRPSWSSTPELQQLTNLLKILKKNIKILHKRDYLSITPKMEDIALVNRWIQNYNVKHFYLQVFLTKHILYLFTKFFSLLIRKKMKALSFLLKEM